MQSTSSKAKQYLEERWQQQRDYYSKQSAKNKRWYQRLLLFSTVGALMVPVLLNIAGVPKLVPTILSLLVSVALAVEVVYHYGDNWRSFRQTLEALKIERVLFESEVDPYSDPQTAFPLFVQRCEDIMRVEGTSYFERHKSRKQEDHPN
jgi:hypothetical protein